MKLLMYSHDTYGLGNIRRMLAIATYLSEREADLYPLSQTKAGITVAVDEISNTERATQYFGIDMFEHGILPINVVISNHTERSPNSAFRSSNSRSGLASHPI